MLFLFDADIQDLPALPSVVPYDADKMHISAHRQKQFPKAQKIYQ